MLHEKMQKQVPAWSLVAVAVGVVLLFAVGAGLYNSGWSNGLTFGLLANGGTNSNLLAYQAPALGHGMGHVGWGHGSFLGGIPFSTLPLCNTHDFQVSWYHALEDAHGASIWSPPDVRWAA